MRWSVAVAVAAAACGGRDPKPAYQGCDLEDAEELCEEPTECVESAIVADGNGWCTAPCIAGEGGCPAQVDGLPADCHQPDGAASAQCYVECPDAGECPLSTTCVEFTEGGAAVALCVPR